jgi:DNA-directed RNA polymerase specialized sigma24 family protein
VNSLGMPDALPLVRQHLADYDGSSNRFDATVGPYAENALSCTERAFFGPFLPYEVAQVLGQRTGKSMESEGFPEFPGDVAPERFEQAIVRLEPWLRRVIRLRLAGGRLRRVADTCDVFQSLLKDFLLREGNPDVSAIRGPSLKRYLLGAVRNKVKARLRKEQRNAGSLEAYPEPVSAEPDPQRVVSERDFVDAVLSRLTDEDRQLFEFKREGLTWPQVATVVGGKSDALRMRLRRSVAAAILKLSR